MKQDKPAVNNEVARWVCPKCGRQFQRRHQSHSCKLYPLENHFKGKQKGKQLYVTLIQKLKKNMRPFRIDPVECCIHLVRVSTFAAVKILKEKIRVEFTLANKLMKN
jgi:hypothetical protein